MLLETARFHTTVVQLRSLPRAGLPEVAVIGRSNSGKSSAINALCRRRRLAFSSRTPGRTQALNYFALGPEEVPMGYLVDTPGYGYAQAPGDVRKTWDALAGRYLHERPMLVGVVLALDVRRLVTDLDRRMLAWLAPGVSVVVLLTKCDKLGYAARQQALREATEQTRLCRPQGELSVVAFSVTARLGLEEATRRIEALFGAADSQEQPTAPPRDTRPCVAPDTPLPSSDTAPDATP